MSDEAVKTLAVKIALEDSTFQTGIKSLKSQMSSIDSGFKSSVAGIKNWGSSLDAVKGNMQALGEKINVQKQIVQAYQEQLNKSKTALSENSQKMADLKSKVASASTAYQNNIQTVSNLKEKVTLLNSAYKNSVTETGKDSDATKALREQLNQAKQAYSTANESIGKNSEATKNLKSNLETLEKQYSSSEKVVAGNSTTINGYTTQVNNATAKLRAMQTELANTSGFSVISKNLQDTGTKIDSIGDKISGAGQKLTTGITVPIATAAVAISKLASDFEDGMAKIATVADTSEISLDKMSEGILNVSNTTNQSATDIQDALYDAISAGIDTGNSLTFIESAAKLAKGGFSTVATAADGLTSVLNAYGLKATETTKISNEMMVAQNIGKTTIDQLASSISQVTPTAANLNVATNDLFASLGSLTANGISTSESVSGLKSAFSNILQPTADAAKQAEEVGLDFSAAALQTEGWAGFLSELKEKTKGNSQELSNLFGSTEALNTIMALTSDQGMSTFNTALEQMKSDTDYVGEAFDTVSSTSGQDFSDALNELKNEGIKLGKSLTPVINDISGGIKTLAGWFDKLTPKQVETLEKWAAIVAIAGPVTLGVGKITSGIGNLVSGTGTAIGVIGNFVKGISGIEVAAGTAVPTAMKLGTALAAAGGTPIVLGLAAVAMGVVGVQTVIHDITPYVDDLGKSILSSADSWESYKTAQDEASAKSAIEVTEIQTLYDRLQTLVDANGNIVGSKQEVISISQKLNDLTGSKTVNVVGDEVQGYKDLKKSITDVINQKTAEILLTNIEAKAKEAENKLSEAQKQKAQQLIEIQQQELKIKQDEAEASELGAALSIAKQYQIQNEKNDLKKMTDTYSASCSTLTDYYTTIDEYRQASVAASEGDYTKVQKILSDTVTDYSDAKNKTVEQKKEEAELLKTEYDQMLADYNNHQAGITKTMVDSARSNAQKAATEYNSVGGNMVIGTENGINSKLPSLKAAGTTAGNNVASGIDLALPSLTAAGVSAGKSVLSGLDSVKTSIWDAGKSAAEKYWQGFKSIGDWKSNLYSATSSSSENSVFSSSSKKMSTQAVTSETSNILTVEEAANEAENYMAALSSGITANVSKVTAAVKDVGSLTSTTFEESVSDSASKITSSFKSASVTTLTAEISKLSVSTTDYTQKAVNLTAAIKLSEQKTKDLTNQYNALDKSTTSGATAAAKIKTQIDATSASTAKLKQELTETYSTISSKSSALYTKLDTAASTYETSVETRVAKLKTDIQAVVDDYNSQLSTLESTMMNATSIFSSVTVTSSSGGLLTTYLEEQVNQLKAYQTAIEGLKSKGVTGSLLAELESQGVSATSELTALNSMTSEQLSTYVDLWNQKSALAATAATDQLSSVKTTSEQTIKDLTTAAGTDLDAYTATWKTATDDITAQLSTLAGNATTYGADMVDGLANGITSEIGQVSSAVAAVTAAISAQLHFSKPDTGLLADYETWMPDMMTGLAAGITDNEYKVSDAVQSLAQTISTGVSASTSTSATAVSTATNGSTADTVTAAIKSGNVTIYQSYSGKVASPSEQSRQTKNAIRKLALGL